MALALVVLLALAAPVLGLRTAMPSIKVVPPTASVRQGYALVQKAFGRGPRRAPDHHARR